MKKWFSAAAVTMLLVAVAAAHEAWRDRQATQDAARNFAEVLEQIRQAQVQPALARGSRPSGGQPSTGYAALLNAIAAEARSLGAESRALDGKFRAIDLSDVLAPANLTSAQGIARSRATVRSMRRLMLERKRMLQSYAGRMEQMLRDAPVPEDERRQALASFAQTKPRAMGAYRDMENAQKTVVARTSAILDFAMQNLGDAAARDGQLRFRNRALRDHYTLLLERLGHAAAAEELAMRNMAGMQDQAQREAGAALAKLVN